jgi:hypothetical protein
MDFEKFYNRQIDYVGFRTDPAKREEYTITVDWKARQLERLVLHSKPFNNILEVGCAMGILLNNLANRLSIAERIGLDISSENIKVAKELYPGVTFYQGTIEDFKDKTPQKDQFSKFDLVLLSDIVEHIPDDIKFMKEVSGISSFVVINLPLEKCLKNRNRKYGEDDPSGHLQWYDEEMAVKLITTAGFEIINSFTMNAFNDKIYLDMYRKKRRVRLKKKPVHLMLFWEVFYLIEDNLKLVHKRFSEKIFGTNYFALLKSKG